MGKARKAPVLNRHAAGDSSALHFHFGLRVQPQVEPKTNPSGLSLKASARPRGTPTRRRWQCPESLAPAQADAGEEGSKVPWACTGSRERKRLTY